MSTKTWLNKEEFAKVLGTNVNNLNQILQHGPRNGRFPKSSPKVCKTFEGRKVYAPEYVAKVKAAREALSRNGKGRRKPALTLKIPVYEEAAAAFLVKKLGSVEAVVEFLEDQLATIYRPQLEKLQALENEFLRKKKALLKA